MSDRAVPLEDPVLTASGVVHGFGQRGTTAPEGTAFPRQVHGTDVWCAASGSEACASPPEADAVVSGAPGGYVGIVTADCVPILASRRNGERIAAIHAGWRGLAAGVIESGLAALLDGRSPEEAVVAIGPAARACCYEVDEPVREALARPYEGLLEGALRPGEKSGRYQLDMVELASRVVRTYGIRADRIGRTWARCTICDPDRFESYRRDGPESGRLRHFIGRPVTIRRSA